MTDLAIVHARQNGARLRAHTAPRGRPYNPRQRWQIARAVSMGEMSKAQACARWRMDPHTLNRWLREFQLHAPGQRLDAGRRRPPADERTDWDSMCPRCLPPRGQLMFETNGHGLVWESCPKCRYARRVGP